MRPPLAIAVVAALSVLAAPPPLSCNAGSCRHKEGHDCLKLPAKLDFEAVPDISRHVIADEPPPRASPAVPIDRDRVATPYTGPTIGVDSHTGAPTIGYYWSIH